MTKWFPILAVVTMIMLGLWLILMDVTILYMMVGGR